MILNYINSIGKSFNILDYPIKTQNNRLAQWEAYKLGWLIDWNIVTYIGQESYLINGQSDAPAPTTFAYNQNSIADWANKAEAAGNVDYAYLVTKHQVGFQLYPNSIQFNEGNTITYDDSYRTNRVIPYHQQYGVSNSALTGIQQDIVGEYINTMKSKGVEPGLYYNIGKDINIRAGFNNEDPSSFDGSGNYRDYWAEWKANGLSAANAAYPNITGDYSQYYRMYINYVKEHMTHLLSNFDINLLWFDAVAWFPRVALRELYEHVKSIRSNCLVTMNVPSEGSPLSIKPNGAISNPPFNVSDDEIYLFQGGLPATDIVCYEEHRVSEISSELTPPISHNGINYHIPTEVCATALTGSKWFWNTGSSTPRSDLQAIYDDFVGNKGLRLLIAPTPDQDGIIPTSVFNALKAIVT